MFALLFSNTVMDIGTFARLYQEPLTYHLKEKERRGERCTRWLHIKAGEKNVSFHKEKKEPRKEIKMNYYEASHFGKLMSITHN